MDCGHHLANEAVSASCWCRMKVASLVDGMSASEAVASRCHRRWRFGSNDRPTRGLGNGPGQPVAELNCRDVWGCARPPGYWIAGFKHSGG